jgi:hypothetical protein
MQNIFYIINRNCKKISSYKNLGYLIIKNNYRIEEVIRGPSWNPAIYFYLIESKPSHV